MERSNVFCVYGFFLSAVLLDDLAMDIRNFIENTMAVYSA